MNFEESNMLIDCKFDEILDNYDEGYEAGKSEWYQKGYLTGESAGIEKGYADGYGIGQRDGYEAGKAEWYPKGYEEGKTAGLAEGTETGRALGYEEGKTAGLAEGVETGRALGYTDGYEAGKSEWYIKGVADGELSGKADGKQEMFDSWWNVVTNNGAKREWGRGFADWKFPSADYFRPPSTLVVTGNANQMFYNTKFADGSSIDLVALEEELGYPILDTTEMTRGTYMFQYCYAFSHIGTLDVTKCTASQSNWYMFFQPVHVAKIKSIKKLIVSAETDYQGMFGHGTSIEHCKFEGTIAKNGLDMSACTKLDKESIESIIKCTWNSDASTWGYTITLSIYAVATAFETVPGEMNGHVSAEWNNLVQTYAPNWTINLV